MIIGSHISSEINKELKFKNLINQKKKLRLHDSS